MRTAGGLSPVCRFTTARSIAPNWSGSNSHGSRPASFLLAGRPAGAAPIVATGQAHVTDDAGDRGAGGSNPKLTGKIVYRKLN
jgi:hypothetical protein